MATQQEAYGQVANYNISPGTRADGQSSALEVDSKGNVKTVLGAGYQVNQFGTTTPFTITLASLASSTAGVGRQSTLITGVTAHSAIIAVQITVSGSANPTANTPIYVYLIRSDGTLADDGAGASDAGITIINAPLLGVLNCSATTQSAVYTGIFDTSVIGVLSPTFGIAIVQSTGQALNATAGNLIAEYTLVT